MMNAYDAVFIPGGGVRANGELPLWTQRRLTHAIEISQSASYIIPLSAGTTHKPPPLDPEGFPIFESVAAAQYLIQRGIAPEQILVETCSYDTIGNVYFSRVIHIDPLQLKRLLIVTSEFHMPRTQGIFEWIYGLEGLSQNYELEFQAVSDAGIDPKLLAARKSREVKSLENVQTLAQKNQTMQQFHAWLFQQHGAYAMAKQVVRASGDVLGSY
ncbi:YdcF family protein [Leptothoe kymatousa]|uniref:YdcF family protein n=1 Tax=Leptothoe kymatousa TAU-MAC 1615 TaxID=2364775 RepID=A0ABS5Y7G6_9CYAN|nr:YdcF family protein [Leptothoe kymatousa]MBT9313319.1 YdcF family protein [Leptothoe kymatousa TAU-MAC 1615]